MHDVLVEVNANGVKPLTGDPYRLGGEKSTAAAIALHPTCSECGRENPYNGLNSNGQLKEFCESGRCCSCQISIFGR
jgi:hypothetical protein